MRRLSALLALALLAAALLPGCALPGLVPLPPDVVYPSIEPVEDSEPMAPVPFVWQFEGAEVAMSVPVDGAVYRGAKGSQKSALFFREIEELEWIPEYYRAFVDEPHQEPLYSEMLTGLRGLRDSLGLDHDRYAELIVTLVQSLEYRTDPVYLEPKFPVETVGDRDGDCDDKTLLAAALLAREGYDVSILLFSAEQHVSLGIRSDGTTYGDSGYAIVETTTPILFGWVPDSLNGDISLESEPMVIRIGEGTRGYGAGRQTDAIRAAFDRVLVDVEELAERVTQSQADLESRKREAEELQDRMERLAAAGEIAEYNELVPRYNTLAEEFNVAVEEHNALVAEQNEAVETAKRINDGQTDRFGLARSLDL
ncbi:MAG: hypothetical protein ACNA76_04420 [Anaerosomatales bacterium]